MSSLRLLERPGEPVESGQQVDPMILSREGGNLAAPPPENLQKADPATLGTDVEEMDLGADVPTLNQLDQTQLPGIDAPRTATELESDIVARKLPDSIQWRGKISGDGIDITNIRGVLCTGAGTRSSGSVTLACSDGRIARLQLTAGAARVHFGKESEGVDLAR